MSSEAARRKNGPRRTRWRLTPRFWLIVALGIIVYIAGSYISGFMEIARLRGEIAQIEADISAAEARNEALRRELEYLQSDEYIEKAAREELGLVKPGETPVMVTGP